MKIRTLTFSLLLASTALTAAARADTLPPAAIGRVSYVSGTVSTHGPAAQDWDYANLNSPVTTGYSFWTEPKARSEIQAGPAEIRLDEATEVDVTRLDDSGTELNVPQGVVNIHLDAAPPGGLLVDTPQGQVILNQPGSYDIDAGDPGDANAGSAAPPPPTKVTVLEGRAQFNSDGQAFEVQDGESALVNSGAPVQLVEAQPTPFDDWALGREHRENPHQALQFVAPEETGYQDLDNYGQWQQAPQYGTVWYPNNVPDDWTPYSDGQWDYVQPWGWTWVDNSPWGFTPFHYGRWVQTGGRWGWWPGERVGRPVYAPALVAFVGGGGIGVGEQPVGWVPLAPYEVYRPWYSRNEGYWRDVNRPFVRGDQINSININIGGGDQRNYANHYANAAHGATFVHAADFQRGARIHGSAVHVAPADFAHTPAGNHVVAQMHPDMQAHEQVGHGMFNREAPTPPHDENNRATAPNASTAARPAETGQGAPGPRGHAETAGAAAAPSIGDRHAPGTVHSNGTAGEAAASSAAQTSSGHAPGPAIRRSGSDAGHTAAAPNEDMPRAQGETQHFNAAPHQESVTTPREREEQHAVSAPSHGETPRAAPQLSHPIQSAPLSATSHGWQRGNGGGHPQQHAQPHENKGSHGSGDDKDKK